MSSINNNQANSNIKNINNIDLPSFLIDENNSVIKILPKNSWSAELLISLCKNYDLHYSEMSKDFISVEVSNQFFQDVFWPEFLALNKYLLGSFSILTNRLISKIDQSFENQEDFF